MKNTMRIIIFALTCLMLPVNGYAQNVEFELGLHAYYVSNQVRNAEFDSSKRLEAFLLLKFNNVFALEAGASRSSETEDSGSDNTGSYSLAIRSQDSFAGLRFELPINNLHLYGRIGMLAYNSDIHFSEDFYNIKRGGSLKTDENGNGYYLEFGIQFPVSQRVSLEAGVSQRVRQDYFENSSAAFDFTEMCIGGGLVIHLSKI